MCLAGGRARAQEPADAGLAEALFQEGKRLMQEDHVDDACPKLAESYKLDPGVGTLLALALCHEKQGKLATAWAEFVEVGPLAQREGRADRDRIARRHAVALAPRLARLTVDVDARAAALPGVAVMRDGTPLGKAAWGVAVPIDPGAHHIEASAPGHVSWSADMTIAAKAEQVVRVPALDATALTPGVAAAAPPSAPGTVVAPPSPRTPSPPATAGNGRRTIGFVVGGTGIVVAGVGTYFGVTAFSKGSEAKSLCPSQPCRNPDAIGRNNEAHSAAVVSNIAFGVAVAALVTGTYLVLTVPSTPPPALRASLRPLLGVRAIGIEGTW